MYLRLYGRVYPRQLHAWYIGYLLYSVWCHPCYFGRSELRECPCALPGSLRHDDASGQRGTSQRHTRCYQLSHPTRIRGELRGYERQIHTSHREMRWSPSSLCCELWCPHLSLYRHGVLHGQSSQKPRPERRSGCLHDGGQWCSW